MPKLRKNTDRPSYEVAAVLKRQRRERGGRRKRERRRENYKHSVRLCKKYLPIIGGILQVVKPNSFVNIRRRYQYTRFVNIWTISIFDVVHDNALGS